MGHPRQRCFLIRHGETEWSLYGRHTGRTDLPMLPVGEGQARALRSALAAESFSAVLASPLHRARKTCELACLRPESVVEPDLLEWDYGSYEGRTTVDIWKDRPGWNLFDDGAPGGESVAEVGERVDRVIVVQLPRRAAAGGGRGTAAARTSAATIAIDSTGGPEPPRW